MPIRWLTRGDDAGSCDSANRAIHQSVTQGPLRNVSIMAPGPALDELPRLFGSLPNVCLGLHVTLNSEWTRVKWGPVLPPSQVPNLVDERGYFLRTPNQNHERGLVLEQAVAEVEAQLARLRKLGLKIEYLDEHMGVGWVGGLGSALTDLAQREGLAIGTQHPGLPKLENAPADLTERIVQQLKACESDAVAMTVTHPGMDAADMQALGNDVEMGQRIARDRDGDRRMWTDPRIAQTVKDLGVVPTRFVEL